MKGMAKWLLIVFGVVVWASCTQLTNFDLPSEDGTQDPTQEEVMDVDVETDPDADVETEVPPECGNGDLEGTEECDDGNTTNGDGCEDDCTYTCHNDGQCSDGEDCNGSETCNLTTHMCEDGTPREDGYTCVSDPRSICLSGVCVASTCGDEYIDTGATPPESCDPPVEGECSDTCQTLCESDEDCPDDPNPCNGDEYCNTTSGLCESQNPMTEGDECQESPRRICVDNTCQESACGDEYTDAGATPAEECDDGQDGDDEDGCTDNCEYTCHNDTECDDSEVCNGAETCDTTSTDLHPCVAGTNADAGTACDDSLYCTVGDQCDGSGGCDAGTTDPCADSLSCTENESCAEGTGTYDCSYNIVTDTCLIGGACYDDGAENPSNVCQECDGTAPTTWTNKSDSTACTTDNLDCTTDECLSGACAHTLVAGNCLISGDCYATGEDNPDNVCQECVPGTSTTSWSNVANGTACTDDSKACTLDQCQSGACTHVLDTGYAGCYISDSCYPEGTNNPSNECQLCEAATSQTAWTDKDDETACNSGADICCSGVCVDLATCT